MQNNDQHSDYSEVRPASPWNFALLDEAVNRPNDGFRLVRFERREEHPWTLDHAPLELKTRAKRLPEWQLYNHRAGPLPHSRPWLHLRESPAEEITLVPYGCTRLRITEFPVAK